MDESRKITCLQTGCHPKAHPASSARSRRGRMCLRTRREVPSDEAKTKKRHSSVELSLF